jgi:hypothetical protein
MVSLYAMGDRRCISLDEISLQWDGPILAYASAILADGKPPRCRAASFPFPGEEKTRVLQRSPASGLAWRSPARFTTMNR